MQWDLIKYCLTTEVCVACCIYNVFVENYLSFSIGLIMCYLNKGEYRFITSFKLVLQSPSRMNVTTQPYYYSLSNSVASCTSVE